MLTTAERAANYAWQNHGRALTDRQARQIKRMAKRRGETGAGKVIAAYRLVPQWRRHGPIRRGELRADDWARIVEAARVLGAEVAE